MTAHKAQALPSIPRTETPLLKLLWRVYGYLRPYWKQTLIAYASLFAILLKHNDPAILGWIIDTGVKGNQPQVLTWSVLVLLG